MNPYKTIIRQNTAEIWVTSNAGTSGLQQYVRELSNQGYKVVIYRSGRGSLLSLTEQLLHYASQQTATPTDHSKAKGRSYSH